MLERNGYAEAVLINLSKAIDTLFHDVLVPKLNAYGFTKESSGLMKNFLFNHWQKTKLNISFSS